MIDYGPFYRSLEGTALEPLLADLPAKVDASLERLNHGDLHRWIDALEAMPRPAPSSVDLDADAVRIGRAGDVDGATRAAIERQLRAFHPWRKGPFEIFGIPVDTEWRSDWKWNRIRDGIRPLAGRTVLDVGCGSGYHAWRMAGAGAERVIGIDPTLLFVMQFFAVRGFLPEPPAVDVLPLRLEDLPGELRLFDTVFSLGVLYHRRSPIDHLFELREALRPGGELVLETLVIEGGPGEVLVPGGRYARMRNVWFIPTVAELERWLARCGFADIRVIDVTPTTPDEQRTTDWMTFHSLPDFLDPDDPARTIEGHPGPVRATLVATPR